MLHLTTLLAAASNAPEDWLLGTAASLAFIAAVGIPALALNARERKRHQEEAGGGGG
jgi:ABC-type spermidine/putrescine transport system permease subunit I